MPYCRNCGTNVDENAAICVKCGFKNGVGTNFCQNCGTSTSEGQTVCTSCGYSLEKKVSGINSVARSFSRSKEGKILGGVFSGLEKTYGINRWIGRIVALIIPFWPIWLIAYVVACLATPIE